MIQGKQGEYNILSYLVFQQFGVAEIQAGERYVVFIKDGCGMLLSF